ncbi:copper homeostasis protein CutC [Lactobacillus johnsonii 16]|uniref:copper homeostasis protein CutC n=1 Tax=Lactobacillus johnsonii TaxID=33959 RepID=UPI00069E9852|nr:copper homeostasis protein CutC [Lactobacillus johnsonii]KOH01621.1 copper homeostasis protein CutC [Lactobacillus johnsonii 16]MCT3385059.1 copper homeostasis protein CutC [Lactobacillus johnsonii]MDU6570051.1 copper homeostasis protein CutC [Lactobacillus johnsonii]
MIKEVCVENFTNVPLMIERGANRIELNNDLSVGGTTPSFGVIKKTVEYAHKHDVPVIVMIRPRGGNFVYNEDELEIMINDIQICSLLNVDGVTFGCLTREKHLDKRAMNRLLSVAHAGDLEVVMHMAFDELTNAEQKEAINWLSQNKVKRILTHGGPLNQPISQTLDHLEEVVKQAKNKIEILPGGGITKANVNKIVEQIKIKQVHGTKILG